jgi:hypothetical protein
MSEWKTSKSTIQTLNEVFPCFFLSCKGITRKDGERPALFPISLTTLGSNPRKRFYQSCQLCCHMYCLCVNVYCTTATGCQPNCSKQTYQHMSINNLVLGTLSTHILRRESSNTHRTIKLIVVSWRQQTKSYKINYTIHLLTFNPRLAVQNSLPHFYLCFPIFCLFLHVPVYFLFCL